MDADSGAINSFSLFQSLKAVISSYGRTRKNTVQGVQEEAVGVESILPPFSCHQHYLSLTSTNFLFSVVNFLHQSHLKRLSFSDGFT